MPYFYLTGSGSVAGLLILVKEPYQSSKGRARGDRIASRVTYASKGKDPSDDAAANYLFEPAKIYVNN